MKSFPKILALGNRHTVDIFDEEVEITEKVDGSQFGFGIIDGELIMRSKGSKLTIEDHDKMFNEAVDYVSSIDLPDDIVFYGEYLKKPRHNTLAYREIPKNHIALFGAMTKEGIFLPYDEIKKYAEQLDVDVVPLVFKGKAKAEDIPGLIKRESYLGDAEIEGVVVKNYKEWLFCGEPLTVKAGKFVSEAFKEVHVKAWKENSGKSKWETFCEGYRTEARWEKAVQHLKESGELQGDPRDIGNLCAEVKKDIGQEEKEEIMKFLWKNFSQDLMRKSIAGLPEWYKTKLLENCKNEKTKEAEEVIAD